MEIWSSFLQIEWGKAYMRMRVGIGLQVYDHPVVLKGVLKLLKFGMDLGPKVE